MGKLKEALASKRFLCGDGAMGTALMKMGLQPGRPPELWNIDRYDEIVKVHKSYVAAGADIIETNTFGANELILERHAIADRLEELNTAGVKAAIEARAGKNTLIAGSIGPSGRLPVPLGDATPELFARAFSRQARALAAAGADLLIVETMTCLDEAVTAVREACETGLDVVATMTFQKTKRGIFTVMGDTVAGCAKRLLDAGALLVGSNCGNGTAVMLEVAAAFRKHSGTALMFQPNAGLPRTENGECVYDEGPETLAAFAEEAYSMGVEIVGGCCGTTATHIKAMSDICRKLSAER